MTRNARSRIALAVAAAFLALGASAAQAADVFVNANITMSETWTSDNTYFLTEIIYVTNGATLTIEAGTVIRGELESSPGANDPGSLVVSRGSKLRVMGTENDPVVFTDQDDDNVGGNPGTFPYDSLENALSLTGQWGGVILLGRGYVANDTLAGPSQSREVQIEGLSPDGGLGFYGNCAADPVLSPGNTCDDDDSGEIHYMSIRYGGFNLSPNNEINGLTLGAVGRATTIDHVEVFQNKDDGVEFFGGTAQIKNLIIANAGDDGVDYDEGWRGKLQYVFQVQGTPGADKSDTGGEHDGGNNPDGSQPFAIPTIYNATYIGLGAQKAYANQSRNLGMNFRDNAGGRYYNSFFADFGGAAMLIEGGSNTGTDANTSGARTQTAYVNDGSFFQGPDSEFQWEMRDNCFFCFGNAERGQALVPTGDGTEFGGAAGKIMFDPGVFTTEAWGNEYLDCWDKLPIRALTRTALPFAEVPDPITEIDPRATPGLGLTFTDRPTPNDGFFSPAPFKGAFDKDSNWADGWSTMARLGYFPTPETDQVQVDSDITVSTTWTSDNEYVLTQPIYVTNGATLTIQAGTVVRGEGESSPGANDPGTLVIARGSKLQALGTKQQPIVFTDMNDDNVGNNPTPTAPYDSLENAIQVTGQWGGVIVLGRGYVANDTLAGPSQSREVQIEGLSPDGGLGFYGNCAADTDLSMSNGCDDDDSGQIRYVSIRYGGFNLSPNNEINGLTLGAVGRETDIHHIEVFQNKDDGVEFFGGTASIKYLAVGNVGDDGIDYDEGWRGKIQFGYVQQGLTGSDKSDKGGEHDGGNNPDGSQPFAIPTLYNITMVGQGAQKSYANASQNTALVFRDNAGGRYYNSFFADFGGATMIIEGGSTTGTDPNTSGERTQTAYTIDGNFFQGPDSEFQWEQRDNRFWCFGNDERGEPLVPAGDATVWGGAAGKVHFDPGVFTTPAWDNGFDSCSDPLPIRELTRTVIPDPTLPNIITKIDPRPADGSDLLFTDRMPPADGFFLPAPYRGAFDDTSNWLVGWSTMDRLGYFAKPQVFVDGDISTSRTWSSDNEYILTQPVYVTRGATLTIEPGTVIRGEGESSPGANDPGTLIIARGSKIVAEGTPTRPIVFTDMNDDNIGMNPGTSPYDTLDNALQLTGQWGGLVLLGRGYVANDTLGGPNQAREVQIEGLSPDGGLGFYGNCAGSSLAGDNSCDDDDSGKMAYVSLRYGGFNLSPNNEINGLTLGAVGRETDLHHIEVFQNKDDGVEFFGGTAGIKNLAIVNAGDDGIDYDEGWRGKVQFAYVQQGLPGADKSDKGGEHDGGNNPDGSQPFAIPTLFNVTMVGQGAEKSYANAAQNTGLVFRDNAGGRYYNSFFADFGGATMIVEGGSTTGTDANTSGERTQTAYTIDDDFFLAPDSQFQWENRDNSFWCFGNGERDEPLVPAGDATAWGGAAGKVHFDPGVFTTPSWNNDYFECTTAVPLRNLVRTAVPVESIPDIVTSIDPRPAFGSYLDQAGRPVPADGFFEAAPYKGAFSPTHNWMAGWSTLERLGYFPECGGESPLSIPNRVGSLMLDGADKDEVAWVDPLGVNTWVITKYDLLRSSNASNFARATCLETNTTDNASVDADVPALGQTFFYLVRPENSCGLGSLGTGLNGAERSGLNCE